MKSKLSSGMISLTCKKQRLSDSLIHLTNIKDIEKAIADNRLCLLYIKAPDCGVCNVMLDKVERVADNITALYSLKNLEEELPKDMVVAVVANDDIVLPRNSRVKVLEKPFYCFPVVSILNSSVNSKEESVKKLRCDGVRALVVDDESMNLVVAKSIFSRYGMKVTTVNSGQESIDICRQKVFDIIFMDHMMSGMDGVEAMKRIRTDVSGLNGSIPIVALTANAVVGAEGHLKSLR